MSKAAEQPTGTRKLQWPKPLFGLRGTMVADLPREISAGITPAALIIPLNIGYALVAARLFARQVPIDETVIVEGGM